MSNIDSVVGITLSIMHLPLFVPYASVDSLRGHRTQYIKELAAIIAYSRVVPSSAFLSITVKGIGSSSFLVSQVPSRQERLNQAWHTRRGCNGGASLLMRHWPTTGMGKP
jgi:hypothetical protein